MTPAELLGLLKTRNKIKLSESDLALLMFVHDIDASIMRRKNPYDTIRFVELLIRILDAVVEYDEQRINIGYFEVLAHRTQRPFVIKAYMDYMYCYRDYNLIDHLNNNEAWIQYNDCYDAELYHNSASYEDRLNAGVDWLAARLKSG